jgi:acyl-ACP thioesterase
VSASSGWIIVDIEKRRPLRPQSVIASMPLNEELKAFSDKTGGFSSLEERKDLQITAERKTLYTDLDYNGHVNNVTYIKWIEDTLDLKLLEKADKIRLDINYLNEILEGEVIDMLYASIIDENCQNAFAFEGRKKETNQAAFRAELRLYL